MTWGRNGSVFIFLGHPSRETFDPLYLDLLHRSVKKICRWQIFSVGRHGYAGPVAPRKKQNYTSICSIKKASITSPSLISWNFSKVMPHS